MGTNPPSLRTQLLVSHPLPLAHNCCTHPLDMSVTYPLSLTTIGNQSPPSLLQNMANMVPLEHQPALPPLVYNCWLPIHLPLGHKFRYTPALLQNMGGYQPTLSQDATVCYPSTYPQEMIFLSILLQEMTFCIHILSFRTWLGSIHPPLRVSYVLSDLSFPKRFSIVRLQLCTNRLLDI